MKRLIIILGLAVILFSFCDGAASAQIVKNGPMAKLAHSLVTLHEQYTIYLTQHSAVPFSSADPLVTLVDHRVMIDAVASGDVNALKADLEALGMQHAVAFGRIVSGQLPVSTLAAAASMVTLQFAQPATAILNVGNVTSQGDQSMRSDVARTTFGVTGSGFTVGVLSDSFNCLGGAATDLASGDLSPVTVLQEKANCSDGTDEGRAMLQIVHDIAPGASLAFASAFNGSASFAANIQSLAAAGAKVIVDDVILLGEPMFQDGVIAQTVNNVVATGVAYFSSAGNQARQSYQSVFQPGDFFPANRFPGASAFLGGTAHNFDSSGGKDHFQSITIPAGTSITIVLQWDSPFFSACPASASNCQSTQNDLDLYIFDASASVVLAGVTSNNIVMGDAVELFGAKNTGSTPLTVNLMIVNRSGPTPGLIKYVCFFSGQAPTINEFNTQSGTVYGHANAVGAEAVGATNYSQTPTFGVSPPKLENFSSSGGTPILFDKAGNRLTNAEIGSKPEIVAPDGVATTVSGFAPFFGTSAAAPHAAGLAALLFHSNPGSTPLQIYSALESTAIDMNSPGFDYDSGFGLIQGDAALSVPADQLLSLTINDVAVAEGNIGTTNAVFTVSLSSPSSRTVTVSYSTANGTATAGSDYAPTSGTVTFNPGDLSKTITVLVNGDTVRESDKIFFVNLTNAVNATIADGQGLGTISNDDPLPSISIDDVPVIEGTMTGMITADFTVTLAGATDQTVTVTYSTADGTANAGSDYVGTSGILTFNPGTTARTITVLINGDTLPEPDETFYVNLTNPVNATIAKAQGLGTIVNDDPLPTISINDVSVIEGNAGTTNAVFTVTLAAAIVQTVMATYSTANGTATAGSDYAPTSGTVTFNPGDLSKTITVLVNGDTIVEGNETFFVNLTSATNATIADGQGVGTIIDDDAVPDVRLGNISTRSRVLTGDNLMIGGFIIDGLTPLRVLVRSRGPSMGGAPFFVPGTLANPLLRLFSGQNVIAQNDNWQDAPSCSGFPCEDATQITRTGLDPCQPNPGQPGPPANCNLESAILVTLPPGAYTAWVLGADGGTGVGLVEVFEVDDSIESDLSNISTRSFVQTGDNVMIGGMIIEGSAESTVLIRARGPSMSGAPFFVPGTLANPLLQLFSGQTVIAQNNDWQDAPSCSGFACGDAGQIIAAGLDPCQPNPGQSTSPPGCVQESVILITLPPGAYTAMVSGADGGTGVGLVEVFEVK